MILHKTIICNLGGKNEKSPKAFSPHVFFCLLKIFCFLIFKMPFHALLVFSVIKDDTQLNSTTTYRLQDISQAIMLMLQGSLFFLGCRLGLLWMSLLHFISSNIRQKIPMEEAHYKAVPVESHSSPGSQLGEGCIHFFTFCLCL